MGAVMNSKTDLVGVVLELDLLELDLVELSLCNTFHQSILLHRGTPLCYHTGLLHSLFH